MGKSSLLTSTPSGTYSNSALKAVSIPCACGVTLHPFFFSSPLERYFTHISCVLRSSNPTSLRSHISSDLSRSSEESAWIPARTLAATPRIASDSVPGLRLGGRTSPGA